MGNKKEKKPGNDWIIIKLATKGLIKKIEIDTAHFKGNYPDQASVQASNFDENKSLEEIINDHRTGNTYWTNLNYKQTIYIITKLMIRQSRV